MCSFSFLFVAFLFKNKQSGHQSANTYVLQKVAKTPFTLTNIGVLGTKAWRFNRKFEVSVVDLHLFGISSPESIIIHAYFVHHLSNIHLFNYQFHQRKKKNEQIQETGQPFRTFPQWRWSVSPFPGIRLKLIVLWKYGTKWLAPTPVLNGDSFFSPQLTNSKAIYEGYNMLYLYI